MTGDRFRARADKCFRAANSVADPERKLAHLDLADRWLRLATQIDKMDAETRHETPRVCRPGTRELVVPQTPYRVRGSTIEIARVYHSSRRWPERL
jgi:hypothetical protein